MAGDAPIEALAAQRTDFDFDHVQLAGVLGDIMELEPAQHPPCFTRGKGVVERARRVRVDRLSRTTRMHSAFGK